MAKMAKSVYYTALLLLILLARTSVTLAEPLQPITGPARVIDGDTLSVSGKRIRLHGIDAPESAQTCQTNGQDWPCGKYATIALERFIGRSATHCRAKDRDQYGRIVAVCLAGGPTGRDVNAAMVRDGWALAYRRYSTDYVTQEQVAREAGSGMWRGTFTKPWEWRQAQRQRERPLPAANDNDASRCMIKGNISRNGRIYHVPGGAYYNRTKINEAKGERWFCNEAEARAAGWRRSKR
jgi:endonuclease YncB( thermonuclease family)